MAASSSLSGRLLFGTTFDLILSMATFKIREKHRLLVRWSHWIHFPVLLIMLWSGAMIYWANPAYWPELPESFYTTLKLNQRLAEGLAYHFVFMWIFTLNGLIYVSWLAVSGEWRDLVPSRRVHGKFNRAQRVAYSGILMIGAISLATGFAIYKPVQLSWLKELAGGYEFARFAHYVCAILFIVFLVVHVIQVTRAGWNNFRAMVAGYEVVDDNKREN